MSEKQENISYFSISISIFFFMIVFPRKYLTDQSAPEFYLKKVSVGRLQNKEDGTTSEQFQMRLISIKYVYKYDTYGNPCHLVDSLCHS